MVVQVQLCCLDSFPAPLSHLEALVLNSHLDLIFRNDSYPPTVVFTPHRPHRGNGVLLRLHPTTEETRGLCNSQESDHCIRLFVSRLLLQQQGFQQLSCSGTVRPVKPVSLDRVVLGARSRDILSWASKQSFSNRILELSRREEWLLVRRGYQLLFPGHNPEQQTSPEFLVLDCSPVIQGRITPDTSVVLTEWWDSPELTVAPCRPISLCVSDFAHVADSLGKGQSLLNSRPLLDSGFSNVLRVLECRVDVWVTDTRQWAEVRNQEPSTVDVDSSVFMSKRLLLRLGLFNHEWVRLCRVAEAHRTPTLVRERLVSVVVVDSTEGQEDAGFISTTLWFNLTDGEMIPVNKCTLRMKRRMPSIAERAGLSESSCRSASLPFATELHVQPVLSPLSKDPSSCCDLLLAEHFSCPRLVSQGDIITVFCRNHPELVESNAENIYRCSVLFFKIQKVCPPEGVEDDVGGGSCEAFLADRLHTSLYMGASTNSAAPCCMVDGMSLGNSLSPPGHHQIVDDLCRIVLPHLHHSPSLSSCTILLHGPAGSGKVMTVSAASHRLNLHLMKVDCVSLCADTSAASEVKLASVFQKAAAVQPCMLLLRNLHLLLQPKGGASEEDSRVQASLCQLLNSVPTSVVVVGTVSKPRDLSAGVMTAFVHQMALEFPTEEQRRLMLVNLSQDLYLGRDVSLERLAQLTSGFVLGDLRALLAEAGRAACRRLRLTCDRQQEEDICLSGVTVQNQDFTSALETLQDAQSKAVGAPKIPNVRWEDVGGLQQVKKEILDTVQLPLQRPELLSLGLSRTGVLLFGPPGTGKTLLAKAVATECSMTFLSVKGPELINMYVGQSEENIREVFFRARSAAPCVIFFDELDSLAPSRGRSGDSGGVMDRVVSQLLAELDGLHSAAGVFVIGATNRPDLLDQSLLRPGRFDKLVYVGINKDKTTQLQVLKAITRKFQLDSALDLEQVVNRCPDHMTGADLYALCSDAMTSAIKKKISLIVEGMDSEDTPLLLCAEDFTAALGKYRPSVSEQELLRYRNIQQQLSAT